MTLELLEEEALRRLVATAGKVLEKRGLKVKNIYGSLLFVP